MTEFRFYAELGDFLAPARRGRSFEQAVAAHQTAKHAIEALGVPHTEVGLLLVNGRPAPLDCRLSAADRAAVLPAFRRLRDPALTQAPLFAADAHLGRLARHLRFAGFDTLWHNGWDDAELAARAAAEDRVVLTRDRALLMHRAVAAGCFLRDEEPLAQLADVARRYALDLRSGRPARCLECNGLPQPAAKAAVAAQLLPGTLAGFDEFWRCPGCAHIFWRGSHWKRMKAASEAVARAIAPAAPDAAGA